MASLVSEININQHRKDKGTKGNYSLLIIELIEVDGTCLPSFVEERIGSYENVEAMINRVNTGVSARVDDFGEELISKVSTSSQFYILTVSYVLKSKDGDKRFYVYRIYTRNRKELEDLQTVL